MNNNAIITNYPKLFYKFCDDIIGKNIEIISRVIQPNIKICTNDNNSYIMIFPNIRDAIGLSLNNIYFLEDITVSEIENMVPLLYQCLLPNKEKGKIYLNKLEVEFK